MDIGGEPRRHVLTTFGCGETAVEAKIKALGEAAERYCCSQHGDEVVVRHSARDLGGTRIKPTDLMQFSEAQYERRDWWNTYDHPPYFVPVPVDDEISIEWSEAISLP